MNFKLNRFLKEVAGESGTAALKKAVDFSEDLKALLIPRVIVSWLDLYNNESGFNNNIPGTSLKLEFKKNENGYSGVIDISENEKFNFENIDFNKLSAILAVTLDVGNISLPKSDRQLVKLGKSIDLLVKARALNKIRLEQSETINKIEKLEDKEKEIVKHEITVKTTTYPKIPKVKNNTFKVIKLSKSQSEKYCNMCNQKFFNEEKFKGCFCLSDLSSDIDTEKTESGYILKAERLDTDSFMTLVDIFKVK